MADQEGARKSGKFIAVSLTPDVCLTPVGSTLVPVPYMITADLSDSFATSPNVRFGGDPVFLQDKSKISRVTGDEAGTAGGVVSGTHKGIVEPTKGSSTVRVNGKPVVRHGDPCKMNDGNTIGRIIYQGPGGGAPNTDGDTNPPVVPETPEEKQAAQEKRGLWARLSEGVHTTLDGLGFIPGVGIFADLANAGIYAVEGNRGMAILSAVAAAPGIGDGIKAGFMAAKAGKRVAGEVAERVAKEIAEETAEKASKKAAERAAKEAAEEAAEKGTKEATKKTGKDGVRVTGKRMKEHEVKCFKAGKKIPKGKHDAFDTQLQRQEDALNRITVDEYLKGREAYKRLGRKSKSTQALRRDEQAKLAENFRKDYLKQGMSEVQAKQLAKSKSSEIMKGLAALHEPDLVAGGKDVIGGFGDAQVNKSIGGGWPSRVGKLDEAAAKVPKAERGKTGMNVKLNRCK